MTSTEWMDQALCAQTDPEIFFSDSGHYEDAKKICNACPVRTACLDHVQSFEDDLNYTRRFGFWASTTPRNRARAGRSAEIEDRRKTVVRLRSAGHSARVIATEVGVTERAVRHILQRHQDGLEEAA